MLHGIMTPWSLPGYKFFNLVMAHLTDDKTPEALEDIENTLSRTDYIPHPFLTTFEISPENIVGMPTSSSASEKPEARQPVPDYLPIEEQKRREFDRQGKAYRVPEWWQGEQKNYKVAQTMMKTIPRDIGPIKK